MIYIYTDGSATKTRSGWGWVLPSDDQDYICNSGKEDNASNQRMELVAAVEALNYWRDNCPDEDVTIWSDSAYLCNCYADRWWVNWIDNGWLNSKREPVANKDLWELLIPYFQNNMVHIEKVKGHSGHAHNDLADKLAKGVLSSAQVDNLIFDEKNDKINIELSEILLDYKMSKYPVDEIIKRIRKVCGCE